MCFLIKGSKKFDPAKSGYDFRSWKEVDLILHPPKLTDLPQFRSNYPLLTIETPYQNYTLFFGHPDDLLANKVLILPRVQLTRQRNTISTGYHSYTSPDTFHSFHRQLVRDYSCLRIRLYVRAKVKGIFWVNQLGEVVSEGLHICTAATTNIIKYDAALSLEGVVAEMLKETKED